MKVHMTESQQLLADFVANRSEPAFRELVTRYLDFVYSAAVRLVDGDTHLAHDISQIVFADLARLAPSLSPKIMLGAWLHRHTCFVAAKTLRSERRRRARETEAVAMNSLTDHSKANLAQIAPILDEAIDQLGASDRTAILLRFFEQRDFRSVGTSLGSNEEAARKRVNRALDKLHSLLKRRGVTLSASALAGALSAEVVTAAPAGLAGTISMAAMTNAAVGGGTALSLLKIMTMTKTKLSIIGAVVIAGVATPLVLQYQSQAKIEALRQQNARLAQSKSENEHPLQLANRSDQTQGPSIAQQSELLRLRGEVGTLRKQNQDLKKTANRAPKGAAQGSGNNAQLEQPTVPLVPAATWTNAGTATADSALWTFHWAISRHDGEAFSRAVAWEPAIKTRAEQMFAAAPEPVRQRFGSIDGVLYSMIAGDQHGQVPESGLAIISQNIQGEEGTVVEQHQYEDGRVRQNEIPVQRFGDGWRILLGNEKILNGVRATLDSAAAGK